MAPCKAQPWPEPWAVQTRILFYGQGVLGVEMHLIFSTAWNQGKLLAVKWWEIVVLLFKYLMDDGKEFGVFKTYVLICPNKHITVL